MLGPGELGKFWHSWFEVAKGETQKTMIFPSLGALGVWKRFG